jgi:carbon starvation protein
LSHKLISPRARLILLSFVYFYLLLLAGAFGGVIAGALVKLSSGPLALIILALAGFLAGQMIYRWHTNILLMTVICVGIALIGVELGNRFPAEFLLGTRSLKTTSSPGPLRRGLLLHGAVLPIWRFAPP